MHWSITTITWIHLVTAFISLQVALIVIRMRGTSGRVPFFWMMFLASMWSLGLAFESSAPTIEGKVFWSSIEYFSNMGIPLFYLPFILSYEPVSSARLRRFQWGLWILPLATVLLVFTNSLHHLIWTGFSWSPDGNNILVYYHGPVFWVAMIYSMLVTLLGFLILVRNIRRSPARYKYKAWYLVGGSFFPYLTALLYLTDLVPLKGLDVSPMGLMFTGLIFFWGITREQFFNIVPAGKQLMIEKMTDGVIVLDGEDRILEANPAACHSLRIGSDLTGQKLGEALPSLITGSDGKMMVSPHHEVWIEAPVDRWFEISHYPVNEDSERYRGSLLILHDITHRKRAEQQLKQLAAELGELNALKDRLYSIIAHDLRSPFNSILGFAELLSESYDDFTDEQRRQFSGTISLASKSAFSLLENLLEWANMQLGHLIFNPVPVNLNYQVDEIFRLLRLQAQTKNIRLNNFTDETMVITADKAMLATILRNLVSNGIKFTQRGGFVEVKGRIEGGFQYITVTDNGIGMDESVVSQLFKVNKLVSTRGTADEKGTGLGLILCHEFVTRHGGQLRVESTPGSGSRFIIVVPV
jgi:signal transduction histidine kinase